MIDFYGRFCFFFSKHSSLFFWLIFNRKFILPRLFWRDMTCFFQESKFNFAKPARDLDAMLEKMGAQRLMPTGFGDDQDIQKTFSS